MMSRIKRILAISGVLALLVLFGAPLSAMATPITGSLAFAGGVLINGTDFLNATELSFPDPVAVTSAVGSFAPLVGTTVTFNSFMLDFSFVPVIPQWEGGGFSFDLMTLSEVFKSANFLVLKGSGIIHGDGFDDTFGVWNFTANNLGGTFSFSAGTAAVPEPGTLMLLGAGLLGIGIIVRRKIS